MAQDPRWLSCDAIHLQGLVESTSSLRPLEGCCLLSLCVTGQDLSQGWKQSLIQLSPESLVYSQPFFCYDHFFSVVASQKTWKVFPFAAILSLLHNSRYRGAALLPPFERYSCHPIPPHSSPLPQSPGALESLSMWEIIILFLMHTFNVNFQCRKS